MKIISYHYKNKEKAKWNFSKVEFGKVNLLVGNSGAGKTKFLNTIFNLGKNVARAEISRRGYWEIKLKQDGRIYGWEIEIEKPDSGKLAVKREMLWEEVEQTRKSIIERQGSSLKFVDKDNLPKLSRENISLSLLKEEEVIKPLFDGFGLIMRRDFSAGELEEVTKYQVFISEDKIDDLNQLFRLNLSINWKLYFLSKNFPQQYREIRDQYIDIFPFIEKIKIRDLRDFQANLKAPGKTPVFSIKERHVDEWMPLGELSSGMQKVLLILTDIYTLPDGAIYLIDEYENSLGVNAINFFPSLLTHIETETQFIITSHHPYLINQMAAENWLIFHRKGSHVKIRYGKENAKRFSRSKQQRFIQLLNDPFYNEGIE